MASGDTIKEKLLPQTQQIAFDGAVPSGDVNGSLIKSVRGSPSLGVGLRFKETTGGQIVPVSITTLSSPRFGAPLIVIVWLCIY